MADTHTLASGGRTAAAAAMRALERRIVERLAEGGTDSGDAALSMPASQYTDPARHEAERDRLFHTVPLLAGFSCDIPNPGDVMLFDAAGPDILIARGKDGRARAFLNMCRHRGARVATECGARKLLTCRFHGWSYDLEGGLVGIPAEGAFEGAVDRQSLRLISVPLGEWGGMIFVKARAGEEVINVEAWLGGLGEQLKHLDIAAARPVCTDRRLDVEANWKYVLNTYGESYHFASLHPTTFSQTAVTNTVLYDRFGPHYRIMFADKSYRDRIGVDEREWPVVPYGGSHYVFPNTIIYGAPLEGGGSMIQAYRMFPAAAPGQSFTLMSTYRGGDAPAATTDADIRAVHDFIEEVVRTEDYSISAEGQRNLASAPVGHRVVLGRNEIALQNVHRVIAEHIGMPIE